MKVDSAVIERCAQTGLYVGFVPGFPEDWDTIDGTIQNCLRSPESRPVNRGLSLNTHGNA